MYKNKKVGVVGIVITIIILIILVILTNIDINKFKKTENLFNKLVMPIQNGFIHLKNKISKNNAFFEDINTLKEQNAELIEENNKLKEQVKELGIIKAENTTLRAYNNMREQYTEYRTVPGYIINKDVSNLSNTMVINIGTDDGVGVNMPVITTEGLVGYIISATNKTAKVNPIIDASGNTSVQISSSRESVIAKGILRKQSYS